jgi:hypothetical protein
MAEIPVDFGILGGAGAPVRDFKAGEVIFNQGDPAAELFVIQSGRVDITLGNRLLTSLSDHDIFGEMALIDAAPRSASAVAKTDVRLVPVGREAIFVSDQPHAPFRAQYDAGAGAAPESDKRRDLIGSGSPGAIPASVLRQTSVDAC